jgi:hypothetical protein
MKNITRACLGPLVLGLSLVLGCGSGNTAGPSGSGSAGATGTAGSAGSAGATACNAVTIPTTMVHPASATGNLPGAAGGTLIDGTYVLSNYDVYYTTAAVSTYQVALVIAGTDIQLAQIVDGVETRATLKLMVTPTLPAAFKAFYTCTPGGVGVGAQLAYDEYTATATGLALTGHSRVLTLRLQ